jgi:hypothetical protein
VGDKADRDNGDELPEKEGLHDPPVARHAEDGGGDPLHKDERGEDAELRMVHKLTVLGEPR